MITTLKCFADSVGKKFKYYVFYVYCVNLACGLWL